MGSDGLDGLVGGLVGWLHPAGWNRFEGLLLLTEPSTTLFPPTFGSSALG